MRSKFLALSVLYLLAATGRGQLVVNSSLTPAQLVQDVLLGTGISASNITYNGVASPAVAQAGSGSFTQTGALGLEAGVILSTGYAASAVGPEDVYNSDELGNFGNDPDLRALVGGLITDHAILEFDFVPMGDTLRFRYVFASKEYPDWSCSEYNDAFGFFLSGPDIAGPYSRGAVNIALLPDGATTVSINNVHANASDPFCDPVNAQYYVDNMGGPTVSHGGYTTVLTAMAVVQCGATYHIKLGIADAGGFFGDDMDFDSAVFIEAGSFMSTSFVPSLVPGPGIVGNTMYEGCFPMAMSFLRIGDLAEPDTFRVSYSGTFTNGVDIVPPLPAEIVFGPGEGVSTFTFNAPVDADGPETVVITISTYLECAGDTIHSVFTFDMEEAPALEVSAVTHTVQCGSAVEIAPAISGGYGAYMLDWGALGTGSSITVSPLEDTSYLVMVTDSCGLSGQTSVPVTVTPRPNPFNVALAPGPSVTGTSVQESCIEVAFIFSRTGSLAQADTVLLEIAGQATPGEDYTALPVQVVFAAGVAQVSVPVTFPQDPDGTESLILRLGAESGCGPVAFIERTFLINQAPAIVPVVSPRVAPCGGTITLSGAANGGRAPYTYTWPDGSVQPTYDVSPLAPTGYEVLVTDACGDTARATINVQLQPPPPMTMQLLGPSTVTEGCTSTSARIDRPQGVVGDLLISIAIGGNGVDGSDMDVPPSLTIAAGQQNVVLVMEALDDGVPDDGEQITITATFTDACGRAVNASVTVMVVDAPVIDVSASGDVTVPCSADSIPLMALASGGFGTLHLAWSTGAEGAVAYGHAIATQTYTVTATDDCDRTATATTTITVDCGIVVPNVFTPNGDGRNDRFEIEGILHTTNTLKVFNRWGQVVYEAKNYRNTWTAMDVPDGTYYYEVVVDRHEKPYAGHVTILRK
ncbi:MAG: choice-of-anchor L domain-containing protein [Flavobacteriales bacterium]|nr:choice-of-anchor L domain-containing protein [Flavobacteriales bacterium]